MNRPKFFSPNSKLELFFGLWVLLSLSPMFFGFENEKWDLYIEKKPATWFNQFSKGTGATLLLEFPKALLEDTAPPPQITFHKLGCPNPAIWVGHQFQQPNSISSNVVIVSCTLLLVRLINTEMESSVI